MSERIKIITGELLDAQKRYENGDESFMSILRLLKCAHDEISIIIENNNPSHIINSLTKNIELRERMLSQFESHFYKN